MRYRWAPGQIAAAVVLQAAAALALAATPPATPAPALAPAPAPAATAKVPLTPNQIKDLVDQGQWVQAIAAINRIMDPNHPADFDRHAMQVLRAECTLQLKQATTALSLLDGIRKQAHESASRLDESRAAALMFLIHKSPGLLYTPKTAEDKTPVNILNRDARDGVFRDLFDDELAVSQQMTKEAAFGTSLTPVVTVCDELYSVQAVELVVTGDIAKTKAVALQLIKSARVIMVRGELGFDGDIVTISEDANRVGIVNSGTTVRNGRLRAGQNQAVTAGLSPPEKQRLADIEKDCDGIIALIDKLRALVDDPYALSGPYDRAAALKLNCEEVLDGEVVDQLGPVPNDENPRHPPRAGGSR